MEDRTQYGTKSCKLGRCTVNYLGDHATPGCGCLCHNHNSLEEIDRELKLLCPHLFEGWCRECVRDIVLLCRDKPERKKK